MKLPAKRQSDSRAYVLRNVRTVRMPSSMAVAVTLAHLLQQVRRNLLIRWELSWSLCLDKVGNQLC